MTTFDILNLFHSLLSPKRSLDVEKIDRMGVLAVKIAQLYAMRPDIVPIEKCATLSTFLQNSPPLNRESFDGRWHATAPDELKASLDSLDPAPIAAASIGQVHRGKFKTGEDIAVKIAKQENPGQFNSDIKKLRRLAQVLTTLFPRLEKLADPQGTIDSLERLTRLELDFLREISGARKLEDIARNSNNDFPYLSHLRFPRFYPSLSNESCLVSDFIEGPTIEDLIQRKQLSYETLLKLFQIQGHFLFVEGIFHGDLHPGNVIHKDGQFWFLDNANIETLSPKFGQGLLKMLHSIGNDHLEEGAEDLAALSTQPISKAKFDKLRTGFISIYEGNTGLPVGESSLTEQMMKTVKLAVSAGITFPNGAFPVIKSLMNLDGMVLRSNPEACLLKDVAPFAEQFLNSSSAKNYLQPTFKQSLLSAANLWT